MTALRPIRLGIVGANTERGWARDAHLPAIRSVQGLAITAVSARTQPLADQAAAAFGAARGYADSFALIADPQVDLVVVTVRVPEHYAPVMAALAAGKHVYCEWPLGRTVQQASEMAAAVGAGQRAIIGAQALSAPAIRHAIALLRDGAIGIPKVLRAYNTAAAWGPVVAARSYLQDKSSGATMATIGMGHMLPAIDALVGPYQEIDARSTVLYPTVAVEAMAEPLPRGVDDHFLVLGRHSSGCVSTLEAIGGTSSRTALLEVLGERGWLRLYGTVPGSCQIARLEIEASLPIPPLPAPVAPQLAGPPANLAEVYARLVQDLSTGSRTLPDFDDALRIARVIDAIDIAAASGHRQQLDRDPLQ